MMARARRSLLAVWVLTLAASTLPRVAGAEATVRAARVASYTIHATYDAAVHTVTGRETILWRNTTKVSAHEIQLHLYLNAFANNESSFIRESFVDWRRFVDRHPNPWGYIDIAEIRVGGVELTPQLTFIHPDDDNVGDRTVARLPLPSPILPGEETAIDVEFVAKLPRAVARTGHAGPYAMVAQWFPKIGVFEAGRWNCHQYHATTEFFSTFGTYDVTLTVPATSVVGATGILSAEQDNHDGSKTLRFVAEDVHDFAWAVDPRFHVVERVVEDVPIRLLIQPNHDRQVERHLQAAAATLRSYREWFGPYPYPQLTLVDPGPGAMATGGMEYPMLITVGTAWWLPAGLRMPEATTVHEIGHQYWYGMVANNEVEDAWLDEGINSFVEAHVFDEELGSNVVDLFGFKAGWQPLMRARYLMNAQRDPIVRAAWRFLDDDSYGAISYSKTALALETLDRYLGDNAVRVALAAYFRRWQFKHPRGKDFFASLKESSGQDLSWFVDQVFHGTEVVDYTVTRVSSKKERGFGGYRFAAQRIGEQAEPEEMNADVPYRSEVVVERLGGVKMPVEILVVFDDGTSATEKWDGQDRWKRFEYSGPQRVEWAMVDPNQILVLDVNYLNNSRMRSAATRGVVRLVGRWTFWFQNLLQLVTGL